MALANSVKRYIDNSSGIRLIEECAGSNHWVLAYLFHNMGKDVFQKDLEEAFSLRRSTVSKAVKIMEQKGLVKRENVDYDARLKKLVLTPKALKLNEVVKSDMNRVSEKVTENLSDEQIHRFLEILKIMKQNFD